MLAFLSTNLSLSNSHAVQLFPEPLSAVNFLASLFLLPFHDISPRFLNELLVASPASDPGRWLWNMVGRSCYKFHEHLFFTCIFCLYFRLHMGHKRVGCLKGYGPDLNLHLWGNLIDIQAQFLPLLLLFSCHLNRGDKVRYNSSIQSSMYSSSIHQCLMFVFSWSI